MSGRPSASHSTTADSTSVSSTVCKSNADRLITFNTSRSRAEALQQQTRASRVGSGEGLTAVRLLGIAPLIFVGRISYSLYLWHWPLIVFAVKYNLFDRPSFFLRTIIVLNSGIAAYASYRWIEQPFRRRNSALSRIGLYAAAATSMALIGVVGMFAQTSNGWPERFPDIAAIAIEPQLKDEQNLNDSKCFVDNPPSWGKGLCFLSNHSQTEALL
jgi:hypothetical protein